MTDRRGKDYRGSELDSPLPGRILKVLPANHTHMMHGYYNGYYPYHIFGSGFMILIWIILVIALIRYLRGGRTMRHWGRWNEGSKPTDILKERYAKGEITKEQFEQMKKDVE